MNKKIYDLIKSSGSLIKKDYKVFADDAFGSWQTTPEGNNGSWGYSEGFMFGHHNYAGNGVNYRGNVNSVRTFDLLSRSSEISFELWYEREGSNVWEWRGYDYTVNIASKIIFNKSGVSVNGNLLCEISETNHHLISVKQNHLVVDNISYPYPDGFRLSDSNDNTISCRVGDVYVFAGGYGCWGTIKLNMINLAVKHLI